jgi:site-specific recombinase XerD
MPQPPLHRTAGAARVPRARPVGRRQQQWDAAVAAFLAEGRRRNLTVATLEHYRTYLCGARARQFVRDHEIRTVDQITPDVLRAFEGSLFAAGLSAGSVRLYHKVLLNFANFCRREGWDIAEGVLGLRGPRTAQREPETFTPEEEQVLLEAARCERDRFLIEFMLATGVRRGELVGITVDDLVESADGWVLRIRQGKGRKDRIVPLETARNRFVQRLRGYLRDVRPTDTEERALFLTTRRAGADYAPLSADAVKTVFRRLRLATGIAHAHAHTTRHTFATRALQGGVNPLVLRRVMGHTKLDMVDRYIHYQSSDLLRAWKARPD